MNIFDALYSLCKSHCKNEPHGLFPFLFLFLFVQLWKDKFYMCSTTVNRKDRNVPVCVSMFPSVRRFLWERLSAYGTLFWPNLIGSILESKTAAAESDKTDYWRWISGCYFGCLWCWFCMWRIRSLGENPGFVFRKVALQFKIFFKRFNTGNRCIYGSPSCLSHD